MSTSEKFSCLTASKKRPSLARGGARALVARAAFAVALLGPWRPAAAAQAQAARIDTINPSCAAAGDQVTITGIGFGAKNVKIAVGGVQAQVIAVTDEATFIVPGGLSLGATTVTATAPGGHTGSIAFRVCDLFMPASWAGEWQITITYRNATTDRVVAIDEITDFIRSDERLGVAFLNGLANCSGSISDERLQLLCSHRTVNTCDLAASIDFSAERIGDRLTGSGEAMGSLSGCVPSPMAEGQKIQLSGTRLSTGQGAGPNSTLIKKFMRDPLIVVLEGAFSPFGTFIVRKLEIDDDEFEVTATFSLGSATNGIDPLKEDVLFQVGTLSTKISAGSFKRTNSSPSAEFKFEGLIGGVELEAAIRPLGGGNFEFKMEGEGANLTDTVNPVEVKLTIGNDGGSGTVTAQFD